MGSNQGLSRLDTLEIKSIIYREIGNQRAESYFNHLRRFFALRITKSEFDHLCVKIIGRQHIRLHNRLIRSLIKNATLAKSPPSRYSKKGGNFGNSHPLRKKRRVRPSPLGSLSNITKEESLSKGQSAAELISLGSRPPVEVASVEEGEEVEQVAGSPSVQSWSPVTAPLGVSRSGVSRKSVSNVSISCSRATCQSSGELPDTTTLRNRLERRLEMEGMKISMDSVNLLNNGLDALMRRLIEPCVSLANTRCGNKRVREMDFQYAQQRRSSSYVSMSDFRAGMELNPRILGEEWPILMEKICFRGSDE